MKKKRTRREKFLGERERIVSWARLIAVIEPLYPDQWSSGPPTDRRAPDAAHVLLGAVVRAGRRGE